MQSLQQLANRTSTSIRRRPVLALPVLTADLIGFAAMHLQHALHQPLFELFLNRNRSVLSTTHTEFVLTPQNANKAALLTVPLLWGCYFLNILLYTAALLITATLLEEDSGTIPGLSRIWSVLERNKNRLLVFSSLAFLSLVLQLPLGYMMFWVANKMTHLSPLQGRNLGYVIVFIVELVAVLFLARPALNLLVRSQPGNQSVQLEKMSGLLALIAQFGILASIEHLFTPSFFIHKTLVGFLSREAFTSLLGALPYIPLFVAFATIVRTSRDQSPT